MHRMAFGPRPGDIDRVRSMGLVAYIDEQLAPEAIDDSACDTQISQARLKIRYNAGSTYPARNEAAPLTLLDASVSDLWARTNFQTPMDFNERLRPFAEVRVATFIRAVHSKRQLKEVLVDFWHNHFNVNATSEMTISCGLPTYDRMLRANCLGNFRSMLEQVAKSTCMLYALDNVSNKAGGGEGGNENFARELFELHTLGSDNYFKFGQGGNVGTITYNGKTYVQGYIDEDVYEAASCFTGWTVANGSWELPQNLPVTGEFYYYPDWHWTGQKRVLGTTIPRNQPDLSDGLLVIKMLAEHPGTARHVCQKLCRRLISDTPPADVVEAAVAVWMANLDAADQLKKVVRAILTSNAFKTTWAGKVKRPVEAAASYIRATNATLPVDTYDPNKPNDGDYWNALFWQIALAGQRLFEWPTPTGHPDLASYWSSTNGLLRRWNMTYLFAQSWGGNVAVDLVGQTTMTQTCTQIVDFWIGRICGFTINSTVRQELIAFMAQGGDPNQPPKATSGRPDWGDANALKDRLAAMVQLLAAAPDAHMR